MKKIQLEVKEFPIEGQKEKAKIKETELVFQASRYKAGKGQQGFSWEDMKKFKRIDDALALAESEEKKLLLELEDSEFDFVFENLKKVEWVNASKEFVGVILNLVNKFDKASEEKAKPAEKGKP